jgi:hypothetical protein
MWIELDDLGNIKTEYLNMPRWFHDDGTQLTEEELNTYNVYKVINNPPEINYITHYLEKNPKEEWEFDSENSVINVTYTIHEKTLEEAKESGKQKARATAEMTKTGGTQYPGDTWIFPTDDKYTNRLKIYKDFLDNNPDEIIRYENVNGNWIDLTIEMVINMLNEVFVLYQDAAVWEENKHVEIDGAESIDELDNIIFNDFRRE